MNLRPNANNLSIQLALAFGMSPEQVSGLQDGTWSADIDWFMDRVAAVLNETECPFLLDTDTYKLSHPQMYNPAEYMGAYYTHRGPLDADDHRIVWYGFRHIYETLLRRRITWADIHKADAYLAKHAAGGRPFIYPRDLWIKVIEENNGYIPLTVKALREGEVIYPQVPCFTTGASDEYARIVTWFETKMMRVWSPTTTATKSAHIREDLLPAFQASVDEAEMWRLDYTLHDFGSRGVSSTESGMWAGAGHLVVFNGTDNINAAYKCTVWNGGEQVGQSVWATEHSVMTSFPNEEAALEHVIEACPAGDILSCVADSYDYDNFIWNIVPKFVAKLRAKGIHFVVRPDSGDPVKCVLDGLRAMDAAFGHTLNSKGFKVITGAGVIQGDGLNREKIKEIVTAVLAEGYSAQCVVYGMGGGLLQQQNRDTLKVANKLDVVVLPDGTVFDVMKLPKTDHDKFSLPGRKQVNLVAGIPTVFPAEDRAWGDCRVETDLLETVWDCGPVDYEWESFEQVRQRFQRGWATRPKKANVISDSLTAKADRIIAEHRN